MMVEEFRAELSFRISAARGKGSFFVVQRRVRTWGLEEPGLALSGYIGGYYGHNGKENGSYYNGLYGV